MRIIFSIILLFAFFNLSYSQSYQGLKNVDIGANFYVGIPQGEFKNNLNRNGYGINFEGFWTPPQSLFSIGINLGFLNYGSLTRREPFSYTIPDVTVNVTNTNNVINYHLTFLVKPNTSFIKPYIQGFFGGAYIFTETKIENRATTEEIASSTNFEDYAWNYGAAAGFLIDIYNSKQIIPDESGFTYESYYNIKLNLKVSYLFGSEAEYLKEGSIRYLGSGQVAYDVLKSKTDLLGIHIGLLVNFR